MLDSLIRNVPLLSEYFRKEKQPFFPRPLRHFRRNGVNSHLPSLKEHFRKHTIIFNVLSDIFGGMCIKSNLPFLTEYFPEKRNLPTTSETF